MSDALARLRAPIERYFEDLERISQPRTGLARLLQPLVERLERRNALNRAREGLREAVASLHAEQAHAAASQAGTFADLNLLRQRIASEWTAIDGFMRDLPTMSQAAALARAALYARAAEQTASHFAAAMLPTLPVYPGDRRLDCKGFCKCSLRVVRVGPADWDVYWELDWEAEHCKDCIVLGAEWNPLEIRDGRIVRIKAVSPETRARLKELSEYLSRAYGAEVKL